VKSLVEPCSFFRCCRFVFGWTKHGDDRRPYSRSPLGNHEPCRFMMPWWTAFIEAGMGLL
jgi:hypothetical protein